MNRVFVSIVFALMVGNAQADYALNNPNKGQVTMHGAVLATGCSILLEDRYQAISMGDLSLRDMRRGSGQALHPVYIRLQGCEQPGDGGMDKPRKIDPTIRVRFDGARSGVSPYFAVSGGAKGVVLNIRDADASQVYPGEYRSAVYDKSHNQSVLKYLLELMPDGQPLQAGAYSAILRFNINYQ